MSPHQHVYDRVIGMMADLLCLSPQVDPADDAECRARWRQQRIAEIAIQEFGPDAKAIVQARLARDAGDGHQIERGGGANDRCNEARRDGAPLSVPSRAEEAA
jgi:hypothetical protein